MGVRSEMMSSLMCSNDFPFPFRRRTNGNFFLFLILYRDDDVVMSFLWSVLGSGVCIGGENVSVW